MFYHLIVSLVMLLQLTPQIQWKSEVKETAEGNQIVLTGELDPEIDHVSGTVTFMPCAGDACYMPVDWDFEEFITRVSGSSSSGSADNLNSESAEQASAPGDRSHPRLRKREGPAAEGSGKGPAQPDVSGGWLPCSDKKVEVVSSTKIRKALEEGRVEDAERMLGYAYGLRGVVVGGKQLGRTIGFPTANLRLYDPMKLIPARGVYLTEVEVLGRHCWGMTNVGDIIETNIFDFNEDIYGLDLSIRFRRWLRPMQPMENLDALKARLAADEKACRELLQ